MSDSRYEEYHNREDIKLRLVAEGKCNRTMITFFNDRWNEEKYKEYLNEFKTNKDIHRIVKIENDEEEVLLER